MFIDNFLGCVLTATKTSQRIIYIFLSIICYTLFCLLVEVRCESFPLSWFTNSAQLTDNDQVSMYWRVDANGKIFRLQIDHKPTLPSPGYIALGFSLGGGMAGADIAAVSFDEPRNPIEKRGNTTDVNARLHVSDPTVIGKPSILDMYSVNNSKPIIDSQQDVTLLSAGRTDRHVYIVFQRRDSCHHEDVRIPDQNPIHVLWAIGSGNGRDIQYHGSFRGSRLVNIYNQTLQNIAPINTTQYFDVRASNITLPQGVRTFYHCFLVKVPSFQRRIHAVAFRPLVQSQNKSLVHHMLVFECSVPERLRRLFDQHVTEGTSATCYSSNMPADWGRCSHTLAVWAVGNSHQTQFLPNNVGIPLNSRRDGATYLMAEIHYDNPWSHLTSTFTDSSGTRIYYTERLRPIEAGMLNVGHDIAPTQLIPVGQRSYTAVGVCDSFCTKNLPSTGIWIYSVLLHAHLLGVSVRLRHIDESGRELAPLASDSHYNFNYQQSRVLVEPRHVQPGDQLLVECTYNSRLHDKPLSKSVIFGGPSAANEMCLAFVSYYPRQPLTLCWSSPDFSQILSTLIPSPTAINAFGIKVTTDQAGRMVQTLIDSIQSFARTNEYSPNTTSANYTVNRSILSYDKLNGDVLHHTALNNYRIMLEQQTDKDLVKLGLHHLPEPYRNSYLTFKDIILVDNRDQGMYTLYDFLTTFDWTEQSVSRLQNISVSTLQSKCVLRNGQVDHSPVKQLDIAMNEELRDTCPEIVRDVGCAVANSKLSLAVITLFAYILL